MPHIRLEIIRAAEPPSLRLMLIIIGKKKYSLTHFPNASQSDYRTRKKSHQRVVKMKHQIGSKCETKQIAKGVIINMLRFFFRRTYS